VRLSLASGGGGRAWRARGGSADMDALEERLDAAMADARLGEAVEIAQRILPFQREASFAREVVEMLLHRKRQENKKDPRMAASDEWKIGRVRMIALVLRKRSSTWKRSR